MNLKGKTVIVTGASGGIGKAIALRFAKEGANIAITYRSDKEGAEATLEEITKEGRKGAMYKAELSEEAIVIATIQDIKEEFGSIDVLVNNAGKANPKSIDQLDRDGWIKAFDDNFISAALMTRETLEVMKAQEGSPKGKIINISSINGLENCGRPGNIAYSAAKGALSNFTYTLAKGTAPDVLVNGIAPGPVETSIWDGASDERKEEVRESMYIKRWIQPSEIADVAVFLARNDAMNGEIIVADGGFNLKEYM